MGGCMEIENLKIESISDIRKFFKYLINTLNIIFHPDTPFTDYINLETHEPTFTKKQCAQLETILDKCFELCDESGVDIYDIGFPIEMKRVSELISSNRN